MVHKVRYIGRRDDGHMKYMNIPAEQAVKSGISFMDDGYVMHVSDSDMLVYLMHVHCPHFEIKLNNTYKFTIADIYHSCPAMLLDLLELNGGEEYMVYLITHYEKLYEELQIIEEWQKENNSLN